MSSDGYAGLPVKLYYRIGEVSQIVGVEPHVLRYWESEFRSIRPQKSRKGQRIYSRRDVDKLLKVRDLLYTQGFTIAGARKRLREGPAKDEGAKDEEPSGEARATEQAVEPTVEVLAEAASVAPPAAPPAHLSVHSRALLLELREEITGMLAELNALTP